MTGLVSVSENNKSIVISLGCVMPGVLAICLWRGSLLVGDLCWDYISVLQQAIALFIMQEKLKMYSSNAIQFLTRVCH